MDQALYLVRDVLDGDPERLRRILADHTRSDGAAARLLLRLERARTAGALSHCLVYPGVDPEDEGEPGALGWKVRPAYEPAPAPA